MCLSILYHSAEINKLPKKITAYKCVAVKRDGRNWPLYGVNPEGAYGEGEFSVYTGSEIPSTHIDGSTPCYYASGFHLFLNKYDAFDYEPSCRVVKCIVDRDDVTAIGRQYLYNGNECIIAKKAIFSKV